MRQAAVIALAVALAGCGGGGGGEGEGLAPRPTSPPAAEPMLVATVGDSITAGYPRWDPSPQIRRAIRPAPDERSQYQYWARRHLGGAVQFRNCGVSGATTAQIKTWLGACVRGAQALIVQGGVNDLFENRPIGHVARDLRSMVRRGKELGLRVAIAQLLPVTGAELTLQDMIIRLNAHIERIAAGEGATVLRWYAVLEDPHDPGQITARLASDAAHPSVAGYRRLGETVTLPRRARGPAAP